MARIDHTSHNHPNTPAARAACRKNGAPVVTPAVAPVSEIKMTGAVARRLARQAAKADAVRIGFVKTESNCTINEPHCQLCGRTNPDSHDGYTACCNEPVEFDAFYCRGGHVA